jgi:hypothetical protein
MKAHWTMKPASLKIAMVLLGILAMIIALITSDQAAL